VCSNNYNVYITNNWISLNNEISVYQHWDDFWQPHPEFTQTNDYGFLISLPTSEYQLIIKTDGIANAILPIE